MYDKETAGQTSPAFLFLGLNNLPPTQALLLAGVQASALEKENGADCIRAVLFCLNLRNRTSDP
jgi:hypothetical protein